MKNEIVVAKKKTIVRDGKVLDVIPFTLEPKLEHLCGILEDLTDEQHLQRWTISGNIRRVMESKGYYNITVSMPRKTVTGIRKDFAKNA